MAEEYLNELNEQQREAVKYTDGPSLVIAGAGSGKTRVLTYKIIHLLNNGYNASRILALTFTNKAAREMIERMSQLVDENVVKRLWMGTFHSVFLRILRSNSELIGFKPGFTIYDSSDSKALIKVIIKHFDLDDKYYRVNSIQSTISRLKNALITPERYAVNPAMLKEDARAKIPEFHRIYSEYCRRCRVANAMDFDDILLYTNILLRDNEDVRARYEDFFSYILVDEYQDTNFSQHLIIRQLAGNKQKVCVVGDDAQSIYSFRGANIENILNLNSQFANLKTFKLEQNYRSTQTILNAANSLIRHNTNQIPKEIFSTNEVGRPITVLESYSGFEESYAVASKIVELKHSGRTSFDDFAILYRTNAQSRAFEESLRKRNIPYRIYGGLSFYQRKEVKDVISYLRIALNPNDDEAFRRIINIPARGIGDTTMGKIQDLATEKGISLYEAINDDNIVNLKINNGTKGKLVSFRSTINDIIQANESGTDAETITRSVIMSTGILNMFISENTPENISRRENIAELVSDVANFVTNRKEEGNENIKLVDFLSEISLATDQDSDTDAADGSRVTLMTVHAAKGLEFKNIFIVGLEEELFPAAMSSDSIKGIEEERRLMYVAITRAKENCVISHASTRFINGQTKLCSPSRFLREIDSKYLSTGSNAVGFGKPSTKQEYNTPKTNSTSGYRSYNNLNSTYRQPAPLPISRPSAATANSNNSSSSFSIHSISELREGMKIIHSRFGEGTISKIDTSTADHKIIVEFSHLGSKTLLLKYAKFAIA